MTPPFSDSSSSSWIDAPEDIEQIQRWIDHPSLDSTIQSLPGSQRARLGNDASRCIELLKCGPEIAGADGEPARVRFENPQLLGAGGFGLVFRAWDRQLKRDVAIKFLRPSVQLTLQMRARFALEAEALARCRVEGIIPVYDCGSLGGTPYLVTGFINGPSLLEYCRKHPMPMEPKVAARLVRDIALAVQEAHRRGILHRDLKPSNILLESLPDIHGMPAFRYRPYVSDFGLAKDNSDDADSVSGDRSTDTPIVGTIRYMSPEQAAGDRSAVSIESDIYSLGVILFELVTGYCPHQGATKEDILERIRTQPAPSPREFQKDLPRELEMVIRKALAHDRTQRYPSAEMLADDLSRFLDGRPTKAGSSGVFRTMGLWIRRNPGWAALWLSLWIGTIGTSLFIYGLYRQNKNLLELERAALVRSEEDRQDWLVAIQDMYRFLAESSLRDKPKTAERELSIQRKALEHCERFAMKSQFDDQSLHLLSIAHHYVSNAYERNYKYEESKQHRMLCLALIEDLLTRHPNDGSFHFDRFMSYFRLVDALPMQDSVSRIANLKRALQSLEKAIELSGSNIDYEDALAAAWYKYATSTTDLVEAEGYCAKSIELSTSLYENNPDKPFLLKHAIACRTWLGQRAFTSDDIPRAREHVETALKDYQRAFSDFAISPDTLSLETPLLQYRARIATRLEQPETEAYFEEAIRSTQLLHESLGRPQSGTLSQACLMVELSTYLARIGSEESARAACLRARELVADYEPKQIELDTYRELIEQINRFP